MAAQGNAALTFNGILFSHASITPASAPGILRSLDAASIKAVAHVLKVLIPPEAKATEANLTQWAEANLAVLVPKFVARAAAVRAAAAAAATAAAAEAEAAAEAAAAEAGAGAPLAPPAPAGPAHKKAKKATRPGGHAPEETEAPQDGPAPAGAAALQLMTLSPEQLAELLATPREAAGGSGAGAAGPAVISWTAAEAAAGAAKAGRLTFNAGTPATALFRVIIASPAALLQLCAPADTVKPSLRVTGAPAGLAQFAFNGLVAFMAKRGLGIDKLADLCGVIQEGGGIGIIPALPNPTSRDLIANLGPELASLLQGQPGSALLAGTPPGQYEATKQLLLAWFQRLGALVPLMESWGLSHISVIVGWMLSCVLARELPFLNLLDLQMVLISADNAARNGLQMSMRDELARLTARSSSPSPAAAPAAAAAQPQRDGGQRTTAQPRAATQPPAVQPIMPWCAMNPTVATTTICPDHGVKADGTGHERKDCTIKAPFTLWYEKRNARRPVAGESFEAANPGYAPPPPGANRRGTRANPAKK
jgi:hypothetical protein